MEHDELGVVWAFTQNVVQARSIVLTRSPVPFLIDSTYTKQHLSYIKADQTHLHYHIGHGDAERAGLDGIA